MPNRSTVVKSTTGHSSCHSASRGATGNDQDCQKSRAHRPAGPCEAALRGEAAVPGADGGPDDVPDLSPNLPPPSRRAARPCEAAWRGEAAAPTADRARLLTVGSQQTERQHRRRTIPDDVPEPRGPTTPRHLSRTQPSVGQRNSTARPTKADSEPVMTSDGAACGNPAGAASGAKARAGAAAETMGRSDAEEATPRRAARRRGAV